MDLTRGIGGKNAVLGKSGVTNDAIQSYLAAGGSRHAELRAGKGLPGGAVPFLDNELAFRSVFECQGNSTALFDLHRLGLGINNEPRRGLGFRDHHALAGGQALNPDLAVFVSPINAVAVADQGSIRIGDFELCIRQGDGGIDRTNLPDEQDAIRHIFKPNGND